MTPHECAICREPVENPQAWAQPHGQSESRFWFCRAHWAQVTERGIDWMPEIREAKAVPQ